MVSDNKVKLMIGLLPILIILLVGVDLSLGEMTPAGGWAHIFSDSDFMVVFINIRLARVISAFAAGIGLGVCGILMQSFFRNPLAGPYVLGVHTGPMVMMALLLLGGDIFGQNFFAESSRIGISFICTLGSFAILMLLLTLGRKFSSKSSLLIIGLLLSQMVSGFINILVGMSKAENLKSLTLWNLGGFERTVFRESLFLLIVVLFLSLLSFILSKRLNILLLGERYSVTLGVNLKKVKYLVIVISACFVGIITTLCGPISFIGIISPHIFRRLTLCSNHYYLIPGSAMVGACLALSADIIGQALTSFYIPLNGILGVIGVPLIFFYLFETREAKWQ